MIKRSVSRVLRKARTVVLAALLELSPAKPYSFEHSTANNAIDRTNPINNTASAAMYRAGRLDSEGHRIGCFWLVGH